MPTIDRRLKSSLLPACMLSFVAVGSFPRALSYTPTLLRPTFAMGATSAMPPAKRRAAFVSGGARKQARGIMDVICAAERSTVALPTGVEMEYFHTKPSGASTKPPILFVHGSFHGGWCWAEHWMQHLADLGYPSYAPSLRGTSGTAVQEGTKSVELTEHTADIEAFMNAVLPADSKPVLAGHSFGGLYVQKVAETMQRPIHALVMLASVGPSGTSGTVNRYIWSKPLLAWAIVQALVLKQAATNEAVCRKVFFGEDVASSDLARFMDRFKLDCKIGLNIGSALKQFPSKTCMTEEGIADWLGRAPPILVVGAEEDKIVDAPAVVETARFYQVEPQWVKTSHEVMLVNGWREGADLLAAWLDKTL